MHTETITVFNRLPGKHGTADTWFPTVLHNCNVIADRSAVVSKYGSECKDSAVINVPFSPEYRSPKAWLESDHKGFTFKSGQLHDFIYVGEWEGPQVNDSDYPDGFYQHMNARYDGVYAVTGCAEFSVIPHFEVTAR